MTARRSASAKRPPRDKTSDKTFGRRTPEDNISPARFLDWILFYLGAGPAGAHALNAEASNAPQVWQGWSRVPRRMLAGRTRTKPGRGG